MNSHQGRNLNFWRGKKINPILQSEASECGLACMAMIATHHGLVLSLQQMRRSFSLSLKGAKLSQLIAIAGKLGFQSRPVRLELNELSELKLPCILHWDMSHFVVLAKVGQKSASILDPAKGAIELGLDEVSKHFTGVALELSPGHAFVTQEAIPAVTASQLTGKVHGLKRALTQILLLSIALQVFVLLAPFFAQWVIDQVLVAADRELLTVLGIGFGLSLLLQLGIGTLRGWSIIYLSTKLGLQWMNNVFAHVLRLPLDFFEKRHLGDITSRMHSVQAIQKTLTTSFIEGIIDGLMAIATLALMLIYSAKLALVTLLAVAAYLLIRALAYRSMREHTESQLIAAAKQQTHLLESLRGMQSLKVSGQEFWRKATYENLMVDTLNQEVRLSQMGLGFSISSQLIFGLERIAVIWIGAILALQNIFSVGMLVAYLAYKDQFAQRMSALIDKWVEFRMLRLHAERLADIVLTPPETDAVVAEVPSLLNSRIEVMNLSFRYADGEPWVLKDCSFSIEPGESVAVIGASGCGKSSLLKLLLGLLKPVEGTIKFGGTELEKLGINTLRSKIGAVMQEDQLFSGSIADNISFFDLDYSQERVEVAAKLASVHEEIMVMPMAYHSLIGDMGSTLSGGQKQRVILARALYRNPELLLLDEATSQLDVMRERLVNEAVGGLKLTKIIVAHRPETIASAQRVLVLQGGRIVQELRPQVSPTPSEINE